LMGREQGKIGKVLHGSSPGLDTGRYPPEENIAGSDYPPPRRGLLLAPLIRLSIYPIAVPWSKRCSG